MPNATNMQDNSTAQAGDSKPQHDDALEDAAFDGAGATPERELPGDPEPDRAGPPPNVESELAQHKDAWLRARADLDNARKQAALDVLKAHKFAIERFAEDLLPVADSLQQALSVAHATPEQLRSGVELTLRQLQAAFGRAQLVEIDPAGERFDPHQHQAMQMVESDQAPSTVVQVFQKGYALNDRVLRPALVTVAKG